MWSLLTRLGLRECCWPAGRVELMTDRRLWQRAACPGTPHPPASEELAWLRARVAELEAVNARLREAARLAMSWPPRSWRRWPRRSRNCAGPGQGLIHLLQAALVGQPVYEEAEIPVTARPVRPQAGQAARRPVSTLKQSPDPGQTVFCGPAACGCCGHDLTGEPVLGVPQKRQVFEAPRLRRPK